MNSKQKFWIILALLIGILTFGLATSYNIYINSYSYFSLDQLSELEEKSKVYVNNYIEEKYGFTPNIESVDVQKIRNYYNDEECLSGRVYIACSFNGKSFCVEYYNSNSPSYYESAKDNYQQEEIYDAIYQYYVFELGKVPYKYNIYFGSSDYISNTDFRNYLVYEYYNGENLEDVIKYESPTCIFEYVEDTLDISYMNNLDNWVLGYTFQIFNYSTIEDYDLVSNDIHRGQYIDKNSIAASAPNIKDLYLYSYIYDIDAYSNLEIRTYKDIRYLCFNSEDYSNLKITDTQITDKDFKKYSKESYNNITPISNTYSISGNVLDNVYIYALYTEENELIGIENKKDYLLYNGDSKASDDSRVLFLNKSFSNKNNPIKLDYKITLFTYDLSI